MHTFKFGIFKCTDLYFTQHIRSLFCGDNYIRFAKKNLYTHSNENCESDGFSEIFY